MIGHAAGDTGVLLLSVEQINESLQHCALVST